ncbi:MAG: hypothetical protein DLM70_08255 [Chloroflexi bacterium]|nr:MAG: hypothetical protein DLM70_08255 [Chloroflexota bacterium]
MGRERLLDTLGTSTSVQMMLAMSLVALACMMYLAQASEASVTQVTINALQDNRARLQMQSASLHASATSLQSLSRIEILASTHLKMAQADLSTTIWISPRVPRPAAYRSQEQDTVAAAQRSEPIAWIGRFAHLVATSL